MAFETKGIDMMRRTVIVIVVLLSGSLTHADDWLQFRGTDGQGHATAKNLPGTWAVGAEANTGNVTWKKAIPGKGWSSPVIKDGKIYLTAALPMGNGNSLRLLIIDAVKGSLLNSIGVFDEAGSSPRIHSKNSHASSTPMIVGDRIYVHFGHMGTACLDLKGNVKWKNQIDYKPVHGNGGSPLIVGDKIIFSCDGAKDPFIIALNRDTGKEVWRTARTATVKKKFSFGTPLAIEVDGKTQVISQGSGAVVAYNPDNGKVIWQARYGEGYSVVPRPVYGANIDGGLLFVCSGFDRATLLAIRPTGKGDVTDTHVVWTLTRGVPHTPSPLLVGNELYLFADGGVATCVDAKSGDVHWKERVGKAFSASPIVADGRIYIIDERGTAVVLKPGKTFEKPTSIDMKEKAFATFAAVDEALFIRTEEHLYRIEK